MKKIETGIWRLSDGRHRVRTTAKSPATGKIIQREATVETLNQAKEARNALKEEIKSEQPTKSGAPIITVADYAERWIEERTPRLKASTLATYELALYTRILPEIGHLRVREIVRHDIAQWVAWAEGQRKKNGDRYSAPTLRRWWRVLVTMCKDATADGYIKTDPTHRVRPPESIVSGVREKGTLSREELIALVDAARQFTPTRYAEIVTLAYTGMRAGELHGLHWEDIDQAGSRILVRRAVWCGNLGKVKTNDPREVPMTVLVSEAIEAHRVEMIRDQRPGLKEGIVFPSTVGTYRSPSSLTKAMKLISGHAGISQNVSPQVLRRTFNTLLVMSGVDRIAIRAMMGHVDEEMTERYSGVRLDKKAAAVLRLVEG
ncbi:MAG: tyrosine-type recombinase/integrase [Bradymonadaceae bacterium]